MDLQSLMTCGAFIVLVVICYVIGGLVKMSKISNEYIPFIVAIVGGIIAIPGMYIISDFPVSDVISAIAFGMVAGLASTGVNQWTKQIGSLMNSDNEEE